MKELWTMPELLEQMEHHSPVFLFFYTPLCGTCDLAKEFLLIVETMDEIPPIYQVDINLLKGKVDHWRITSVPCLLKVEKEGYNEKLYAFQSVTNVYHFIKGQGADRHESP
ncbi:thioredoxin family protein [Evansella tamaricis]|uniref:Thioredoxin family protein n=1 Tax=Evansella tamaricis TaxID=2069301 RepID=A0ABS6JLT2_9BACI|nr:thioredoxin family protein [Evansella tamaricis]MBU9714646.1 thioredoxin family protein [Evansella tamaricis]